MRQSRYRYTPMPKEEARARLLEVLKPGDTVYCILRHVSRSGMMRRISVVVFKDNEPHFLDASAADLLGIGGVQGGDGVRVGGCGMDMGFHLVYKLSAALWPNGFDCIGSKCRSSDHSNGVKAKHHTNSGYALKQSWL